MQRRFSKLPVSESHEGPLVIRVDPRPTGSAYVYVRREPDKQTWICKVRSLQEISAPTQQTRSLTVASIATCLYHGTAYDSFASDAMSTLPVELHRREVSFTRPETWIDGGYRLKMRVAVRSSAVALSAPSLLSDHSHVAEAISIVDIADDDVVFGLNFTVTDFDLDHKLLTPAYPRELMFTVEITLDIVHPKGPAEFVLAVNSQTVQAEISTSFPQGDLHHTVAQYQLSIPAKAWMQVAMLPGSVPALQ